jgi:AcrR family transcriptional regulator
LTVLNSQFSILNPERTMGVKERRDRDHEAMRRTILGAARELFLKEGYANASIRKIAERIDYSPPAIYRYFTSKEDIFFAVAEAGFHLFHRAMAGIDPSPDPLETLRRHFWRYYEFSKAQPEYFSLMFVDRSVPRISREWERLAFMRTTRDELRHVITRSVESGLFPAATNPDVVFHILATAVHGAAVVRLSDRFIPRQTADALARDVLEATLAGLRHGVPITFDANICFHSATAKTRPASRRLRRT